MTEGATAIYWIYGVKHEQQFDSIGEAVSYLGYGEDEGSLSASQIVTQGRTIEGKELFDLLWQKVD